MAKKRIEDLPVVGDTIVFELKTFGHNLVQDPYKVNSVKIYHIETEPFNGDLHYKTNYDKSIESEIQTLQNACAENPCKGNLDELARAKVRLDATSVKQPYLFKDSNVAHSSEQPAWDGKDTLYMKRTGVGTFEYELDTSPLKDGNYYIVWSWTPEKDQAEVKSQKTFFLYLSPIPVPAHKRLGFSQYESNDKYDFLLKKYLPSMYKTKVAMDDVTASVLENLNWCVAREFTYLENMLVDLGMCYDGGRCPAPMLQLLANFYNIKIRTDNRSLQRRQVKNAIPLLKAKGTKLGLETALDQIGIKLKKLSVLWQVRSPYTWTESFTVSADGQGIFELSKMPINDKFKASVRSQGQEYIDLPGDYFISVDAIDSGKRVLIFEGETKPDKIRLLKGDVLKATYDIKEMPDSYKQIEDYIQSLPLADGRDETAQAFPLKNWNVHLIEDDDPLFDLIVQERHPFVEPLTYGKIRTTFLFSENVYNMDTFNGSLRDSKEPCQIDRFFLDECHGCRSSKFNLDIEVEELSDTRLTEAMEIIREYSPFHAQINVVNVCGAVNEFVIMPHEEIEVLIDNSVGDQIVEVMEHEEEISCLVEYADGRVETLKL